MSTRCLKLFFAAVMVFSAGATACSKSSEATANWWCLTRRTNSACYPWEREFCEGIRAKILERAPKDYVSECTERKQAWCATVCAAEQDCRYDCYPTSEGCRRNHHDGCVSRAVPDHPEIPVGTGWYCWATPFEGKVDSFCSRYLPMCEANLRNSVELIKQDGHDPPSECQTNTQAWCFSLTQGGHSTGTCVERQFDCNAVREVARNSVGGKKDYVFSECFLHN